MDESTSPPAEVPAGLPSPSMTDTLRERVRGFIALGRRQIAILDRQFRALPWEIGRARSVLSDETRRAGARLRDSHVAARLRHRVIWFDRMSPALKLALIASFFVQALLAVLTIFHDLIATEEVPTEIGMFVHRGAVLVAAPILVVAWSFALTAAITSNIVARYLSISAVGLLMVLIANASTVALHVPGKPPFLQCLLLAEVCPAILFVLAILRRRLRGWMILAGSFVAFTYAAILTAVFTIQYNPVFGASLVTIALGLPIVVALPALLVVGIDFTEWVEVFGEGVSEIFRPIIAKWGWLLIVAVAAGGVVFSIYNLRHMSATFDLLAVKAAILAVGLGTILLILMRSRTPERHTGNLGYYGLWTLAAVLTSMLWLIPSSLYDDPSPPTFVYRGGMSFVMELEKDWTSTVEADYSNLQSITFKPPEKTTGGFFTVVGLKRDLVSPVLSLNEFIPGGDWFPEQPLKFPAPDARGWSRIDLALWHIKLKRDIHFTVWRNDARYSTIWFLIAACGTSKPDECLRPMEQMQKSWRMSITTVPSTLSRVVSFWIWIPIFAVVCLLLPWRRKRSEARWLAIVGVVAVVALTFNYSGKTSGEMALTASESLLMGWHTMNLTLLLVAGISLVLLRWMVMHPARAGLLRYVLILNISLPVLTAFYLLMGYGSHSAEHSNVIKGSLIFVALSWEIYTSGLMTNISTRHMPRPSRVLLFLCYIVLIALGIFFFFQLRYAGATMGAFSAEDRVLEGVYFLGLPILLSSIFVHLAKALHDPEAAHARSGSTHQ